MNADTENSTRPPRVSATKRVATLKPVHTRLLEQLCKRITSEVNIRLVGRGEHFRDALRAGACSEQVNEQKARENHHQTRQSMDKEGR